MEELRVSNERGPQRHLHGTHVCRAENKHLFADACARQHSSHHLERDANPRFWIDKFRPDIPNETGQRNRCRADTYNQRPIRSPTSESAPERDIFSSLRLCLQPDLDQAADGLGAVRPICTEAGSQTEIVAESHQAGGNLPQLDESF